jgi:hypothetical protein
LCGTTHLLKARSSLRSSSVFLAVSESIFERSATLLQSPAKRVKVARRKSCFVAMQILLPEGTMFKFSPAFRYSRHHGFGEMILNQIVSRNNKYPENLMLRKRAKAE